MEGGLRAVAGEGQGQAEANTKRKKKTKHLLSLVMGPLCRGLRLPIHAAFAVVGRHSSGRVTCKVQYIEVLRD